MPFPSHRGKDPAQLGKVHSSIPRGQLLLAGEGSFSSFPFYAGVQQGGSGPLGWGQGGKGVTPPKPPGQRPPPSHHMTLGRTGPAQNLKSPFAARGSERSAREGRSEHVRLSRLTRPPGRERSGGEKVCTSQRSGREFPSHPLDKKEAGARLLKHRGNHSEQERSARARGPCLI